MDDFLSLYLAASICKALDSGFGFEDKAPWQAQERNISRNSTHYDFYCFTFSFHDHLDDDYDQDWGTLVMFSSKVGEKDLRESGSFPSSSVYDSQEIRESAG
jgi:hypothetical protein